MNCEACESVTFSNLFSALSLCLPAASTVAILSVSTKRFDFKSVMAAENVDFMSEANPDMCAYVRGLLEQLRPLPGSSAAVCESSLKSSSSCRARAILGPVPLPRGAGCALSSSVMFLVVEEAAELRRDLEWGV